MAGPVRFLMLGCSHPHTRMHMRTLALLGEVDGVILWDRDERAIESLRAQFPQLVRASYTELDRALAHDHVGFAFVCVTNAETPAVIVRAAAAGKHVMTEKPMATSVGDGRRAVEACRKAGVALGVAYPTRFHPAAQDARRWMSEGAFGKIMTAEVRMVASQVRFRTSVPWLFSAEQAGGGILAWLGCHYLDLLRFVLGDEVKSVAAVTGRFADEKITVEDAACLALEFRSGAIGTFHAGYLLPRSKAGYEGATYDTYFGFRGTKGRMAWTPHNRDVPVYVESIAPGWSSGPERKLEYTLEPSEAYAGRYGLEFMRAFVQAAERREPVPASGEDAVRVLEILAAAYDSAKAGRRVELAG